MDNSLEELCNSSILLSCLSPDNTSAQDFSRRVQVLSMSLHNNHIIMVYKLNSILPSPVPGVNTIIALSPSNVRDNCYLGVVGEYRQVIFYILSVQITIVLL